MTALNEFDVQDLLQRSSVLWHDATAIWKSGGWAMWAIFAIALVLFALGINTWMRLREKRFSSVAEDEWRRWIDHPLERRGPIGELLDTVTRGATVQETVRLFEGVQMGETGPFDRDLKLMKVCVSAAPLVGLLGTVTGMLTTFNAISSGTGGQQTMGKIAEGISEALITTETGLVVALFGLFFQYALRRRFEQYTAFLAHVETVCTQVVYRRSLREQRLELRRVAAARLAARVCEAVGTESFHQDQVLQAN